jgi:uncharacterized repeat protein (TIGR01451 family)
MVHLRTRIFATIFILTCAATTFGQAPRFPLQSREPPYADDVDPARTRPQIDPDEAIERVQHVVPADMPIPRALPTELGETSGVLPAQHSRVVAPAGELPTPVVTLNIQGNDISPTGQAVVYKLVVRNESRAKAHNVVVRVIPPKNADKVKADPPATHDEAETRWELKTLEPGQSRTIEVVYKPKPEAEEIKVQARVQYDFGRGMITKVAAPSLTVKKEGPEKAVVGDLLTYRITVTNNGKVTIRDIEVKDLLMRGLVHEDREISRGTVDGRLMSQIDPKSGERMWSIPSLAPGQSKVIDYRVKARDPGRVGSTVLVNAPDVKKETGFDTEVLTANLTISATGPVGDKGTVGQAAAYRITVENKGSAELRNVTVRCVHPPDMRPVRATNSGQPFRDSVQWVFRELKPGDVKDLNVSLVTSTPGTRTVQFFVKADKGAEQKTEVKTPFAGVPALSWDTDVPGTVVAGRNLTYRVTVSNTGTAPAKATKLSVDLPDNVDLVGTTPADAGRGSGQNAKMVIFPAYDIPPGKKTTFRIEVRARAAGEARVVFQLTGEGVGTEPAEHRKTTTITGGDDRGPAGPPPARPAKGDASSIGARPRD